MIQRRDREKPISTELGTQPKKAPGRCDLYFSVENLHCVLESKLLWLTGDSAKNTRKVQGQIREALGQLQSLDKKDRVDCQGLALCWGVATKVGNTNSEETNLRRFALGLKGRDRMIGVYYVPSQVRTKVEHRFGDKGETYPGVVLIGEVHTWK